MFKVYYYLTYPITLLFLLLVWLYQKTLSHLIGNNCHFMPTCSKYAFDEIVQFGWLFGTILGIKRLLKCTPNHKAGVDLPKLNLELNYKWRC